MKVSLNIVKSLIDFELPEVDELVGRINSQLGGVEEVIYLDEKYKDTRIARVVSCEKHPDADKLTVCLIDDGGSVEGVERNDAGLVQVVCGAPNAKADMWAVWLPPKATLPLTYGTDEPFVLDSRKIRGVMSQGMLAAGDELAINNDHEGIVELSESDLPNGQQLVAGANFSEVFGLDDTIIDIENKMFTHRPDLFGQIGVAREIAGIFGKKFEDPAWYYELAEATEPTNSFSFEGFNEAGDNVSRLMFVCMDDVSVGPSPFWLQVQLVAMGSKPINNVVDITNYMMLMTAQPLHAYDFDKLKGGKIGARMGVDGEKLLLLNGKEYELTSDDIVIADGDRAVGLAGIMGGSDTEVDVNTKRIVIELGTFDMYAVRRSSMKHGLFTDALTRFNKGQSMLMGPYVMQRAISLMSQVSGGRVATETYDDLVNSDRSWRANPRIKPMLGPKTIEAKFINDRLGLNLTVDEIAGMLENVGFECDKIDDTKLSYWAPAWRMDIQDPEDVVEEVGRLYGFDKLPRELPLRRAHPAPHNARQQVKQQIRESFMRMGANEALTYSFVNENVMRRAEQDVSQAFQISNALSPDLQYYRLTVLPSLLDKVHMNIKAGHDEFALFEIGKGHNKKYHGSDDEDGLPSESNFVDLVYTSKKPKAGAPYYQVRRMIQQLALDHGFTLKFKPVKEELDFPVTSPFDLSRSAMVETQEGQFVGMIGELKQSVLRNFKLPSHTAAMTLDTEGVQRAIELPRQLYQALSRYPSVDRDISLRVDNSVSYSELFTAVYKAASSVNTEIDVRQKPASIYQADGDNSKTLTFRLTFTSHEKTLTDEDVLKIMQQVELTVSEKCGAVVG